MQSVAYLLYSTLVGGIDVTTNKPLGQVEKTTINSFILKQVVAPLTRGRRYIVRSMPHREHKKGII